MYEHVLPFLFLFVISKYEAELKSKMRLSTMLNPSASVSEREAAQRKVLTTEIIVALYKNMYLF